MVIKNEKELLRFINNQLSTNEDDPSFIKLCEYFNAFLESASEHDEYKGYVFALSFSRKCCLDESGANELRRLGEGVLFSTEDRNDTVLLFPQKGQIMIHVDNSLMFR